MSQVDPVQLNFMAINPSLNCYAIKPLTSQEVEIKKVGRFASASQKTDAMLVETVIPVNREGSKPKLLIKGESPFQKWNEVVYSFGGVEFVLCPQDWVLAISFDLDD